MESLIGAQGPRGAGTFQALLHNTTKVTQNDKDTFRLPRQKIAELRLFAAV